MSWTLEPGDKYFQSSINQEIYPKRRDITHAETLDSREQKVIGKDKAVHNGKIYTSNTIPIPNVLY